MTKMTMSKALRSPVRLGAVIGLLALCFPVLVAAQSVGSLEVTLETLKVDRSGGDLNRYSLTDGEGNGVGFYLNTVNGRLYIERRTNWGAKQLAASAPIPAFAADQWYTLRFVVDGSGLTAEAYPGRIDPMNSTPAVSVDAVDPNPSYETFTQFNVNGGRRFDTDNIRVSANGIRLLDENFDDGDISNWFTIRNGQVALQADADAGAGFVLRKSLNNDYDGGGVSLPQTTLLDLAAPVPFYEVALETLKVDGSGGALNRYSITDPDGNGVGFYIDTNNGRLSIERRNAWSGALLERSANGLDFVFEHWYGMRLIVGSDQITAEAWNPADPSDSVTVSADYELTAEPTRFNVQGGRTYDTDNLKVFTNGNLALDDDFNDGNIGDWRTLFNGQVALAFQGGDDFALRKSDFNDPNGGSVDLRTILTLDPTVDIGPGGTLADYEGFYGVGFENAAAVASPAFVDGQGIETTAQTAVITFAEPVSVVDFRWVRFVEDATFVATIYADEDREIPLAQVFRDACPFFDCSLTEDAGTETMTGPDIRVLEISGLTDSVDDAAQSIGLDSLGFAPQPAPAPAP